MTEALQRIVRGVAAGADPARLLHDTLTAAVAGSRARQGMLTGLVDGTATPLASVGAIPDTVVEAAASAVASGRLTRRSDRSTGSHAVAHPLRVGGQIVGALAVGGSLDTLDPTPLPLLADVAALVLARRPAEVPAATSATVESAARVAGESSANAVLAAAFDEASSLFGATAGFCALSEPGSRRVVVALERGIDRDQLRSAGALPEFRSLMAAGSARVEPATHPVVSRISAGAEVAVALPLRHGQDRLGQLVLLLGEHPSPARLATMAAFAGHVALGLRGASQREQMVDRDEQLAAVVHAVPDAVVLTDDLGRFVIVNAAAAELFHLAGAFEAGQSVMGRLGHPVLEEALSGTSEQLGPMEVLLGSGTSARAYRAVVRGIHRAGGPLRGRILVLQDITTAREAEQVKADFIAVIGHELRTPLTVMKGYLGALAKSDGLSDERRRAALSALTANTDRLEHLIEDLLLVSSLETNRAKVKTTEVHMSDLLDPLASERVHVKRPRRPLAIEVDETKLTTVVRHLVDNALKYSEGEVTVTATPTGETVEIAVADAGPGIYSGDVDRLFERFTQLDPSSTRSQGGTGTGLYICRRLVEAMDGSIRCETRLGQGTRMIITLPVAGPGGLSFDEVTFARS